MVIFNIFKNPFIHRDMIILGNPIAGPCRNIRIHIQNFNIHRTVGYTMQYRRTVIPSYTVLALLLNRSEKVFLFVSRQISLCLVICSVFNHFMHSFWVNMFVWIENHVLISEISVLVEVNWIGNFSLKALLCRLFIRSKNW